VSVASERLARIVPFLPPTHLAYSAVVTLEVGGMQCIICHEEFDNSGDHKVVSLACGHLFGHRCIRHWLNERKTCPNCNKKANRRDIRPIFVSACSCVLLHAVPCVLVGAATEVCLQQFTKVVVRDTTEIEAVKQELLKQKALRERAEDSLRRRQEDLVRAQVQSRHLVCLCACVRACVCCQSLADQVRTHARTRLRVHRTSGVHAGSQAHFARRHRQHRLVPACPKRSHMSMLAFANACTRATLAGEAQDDGGSSLAAEGASKARNTGTSACA
jgi:hypothetical protein